MNECPRCGARFAAGQEYCLECGVRLPGTGLRGATARDAGRGWTLRALLALVVALGGAAAAVAATGSGAGGDEVVIATGGFATLPDSLTLPAPSESGPAGTVEWPAGEDGWTIAIASIPQTDGRPMAMARVRQARKRGLTPVGIIDSSQYASLHPGYWLVFTGIYSTEAEATSALQPAKRIARTATVRRIVP